MVLYLVKFTLTISKNVNISRVNQSNRQIKTKLRIKPFLFIIVNSQSKNILGLVFLSKHYSNKQFIFIILKFFIHTTQSSNKMIPRDHTSDLGPEGNGFSFGIWSEVLKIPCAITSGAKYDGYL